MRCCIVPFILLVIGICSAPCAVFGETPGERFRAAHGAFFHLLRADRTDVRLGYLREPGVETNRGDTEFDLDIFYGALELPLPDTEDFYWRLGFDYSARRYDFAQSDLALEGISDDNFHRAAVLGGAGVFLSDNLLLTGALQAGGFSNFGDGLETDDFGVRGELLFVYRLNPGAQLLLGGRLSEEFEGTSAYPVLGVRLLSEDGRLHISATLPVELRAGYSIWQPLQVYARAAIEGERYNYTDGPESGSGELHVQDRRVGGGFSLWLGRYINIELEAGYTFDSTLLFTLRGSPDADRDLDNSLYGRAQLGFAF